MKRIFTRIFHSVEGLLLIALSLAMGLLMASGNHWLYISPRFEWLSQLTALVLLLVGTLTAWRPGRRPRLSAVIIFGGFVVFGIGANYLVLQPRPTDWGFSRPHRVVGEEPYKIHNGLSYTRINLAELYEVAEGQPEKRDVPYVVRGMVQRDPQLDSYREFLVLRTLVWCCLADAILVGFRVQDLPEGQELPKNGQWIELFGELTEASPHWRHEAPHISSIFPMNTHPRYGLTPHHIRPIEEPPMAFIFEIRDGKPYAY